MQDYIDALKNRSAYLTNPYLTGLRDGSMSREDFVETQIQFLSAVVYFSRPMATIAGRLPRPELRRALLENISDEHGGSDTQASHEQTMRTLLARLGATAADIDRRMLWPEIRAFNTTLAGVSALDDVRTALAAFGIIELMFADIATHIGQSIVLRGFLPAEQLIHYPAHEAIDREHAEGFFANLRPTYASHPGHRYQVEQGLELGSCIFTRLYDDLWRNRQRRRLRERDDAHAVVDDWAA